MYSHSDSSTPRQKVLEFTYPKLHKGKSWYVDFSCFDPITGKMKRKKYMLDSISRKTERQQRAHELIENLLSKLRKGWNPWVSQADGRSYTLLIDALDKYKAHVEKIMKPKTRKDYLSRLIMFQRYIDTLPQPPAYVYQYNTGLISDFLDWIYLTQQVSARTRNNYRGWCSSVASYLIEREYIASNPVDRIKTLTESQKERQPLDKPMLQRMSAYLAERDPHFLLACRMEYYTFIRPIELIEIRVGDISVKDQSVFISRAISKNKRDGKVGLNDELLRMMIDLGILSYPSDFYIFGRGMRPTKRKGESQQFRREWCKLRKVMGWGSEYMFYSLKDSGLRDLANSAGIVVARDQARHTDISTTNKYLQGRDLPVHNETKHFTGSL